MSTAKKIFLSCLVVFVTMFSSITTTMPLFKLGINYFIIFNFLFVMASLYFNWNNLKFIFYIGNIKQYIEELKVKKSKLLLIILASCLAIVPAITLYLVNTVYPYFFLVDSLGMNSDVAIVVLQALILPISIILTMSMIKDLHFVIKNVLYFCANFIKEFFKDKRNIISLIIAVISVGAASYLAYWTANISLIGVQMYKLTFYDVNAVTSVSDVFYFFLFISSMIMFSGTIYYVLNSLVGLFYDEKKIEVKFKDVTLFFCAVTKITVAVFSSQMRFNVAAISTLDAGNNLFSSRNPRKSPQQNQ